MNNHLDGHKIFQAECGAERSLNCDGQWLSINKIDKQINKSVEKKKQQLYSTPGICTKQHYMTVERTSE